MKFGFRYDKTEEELIQEYPNLTTGFKFSIDFIYIHEMNRKIHKSDF